jgi:23S rRNA (pseudouridine1915-N3)-methyltransferase
LRVLLLFVGKTKDQRLNYLIGEYESRLKKFCDLALREIRDGERCDSAQRRMEKEGEALLARIRADAYVLALDPAGESMSSEEFALLIRQRRDRSLKDLVFVVGSHAGLSAPLKRRANKLLSLSAMTLNHEMARLLLVEQIYRAFTLIHHVPYHK